LQEEIEMESFEAFIFDCHQEEKSREISKNIRAVREETELDHQWAGFVEDMELAAATGGRSGPAPRLRSERPALDESEWKPGNPDVDLGLEKSAGRKKNSLRAWFVEQIGRGISAAELIRHAEQGGSLETADALRELSQEMGIA
jgi:hypothetical protein